MTIAVFPLKFLNILWCLCKFARWHRVWERKLITINSAESQKRTVLDAISQGSSDQAKVKRKTRARMGATGGKLVLQEKLSMSQLHRLPGIGRTLISSEVAGSK